MLWGAAGGDRIVRRWGVTTIKTAQDLINAIQNIVEYNWEDEAQDYQQWKRDNPGQEDHNHIFHTLKALDTWSTGE